MNKRVKPKVAVYKFTSCDGCQLSLLDCEDEILQVTGEIDLAFFMEATSNVKPGPYDLAIVEGAISTPEEKKNIQKIRKEAKFLMTIGACATAGGIQALRNFKNVNDFISIVYAKPEYIDTLDTCTAISGHVKVDFELRGCPINKQQLIEVINALLNQRKPVVPPHSVCLDCKLKGNVCVMVAHQTPCLGPITHTGCDALCPSYYRGCYGCFGPKENCHPSSLSEQFLKQKMMNPDEVKRVYQTFNTYAPPFLKESLKYDQQDKND